LERRRWRGNLIALSRFLRRGSGDGDADLFSLVSSARTCGSKLHQSGEGSDWASGIISLQRGWSNPGTGFLERWSMP